MIHNFIAQHTDGVASLTEELVEASPVTVAFYTFSGAATALGAVTGLLAATGGIGL